MSGTSMYGVALRRLDPARNMARFYAVTVQPTLFGQWALVRNGAASTPTGGVDEWFSDLPPALAAAANQVEAKRRRGYQLANLR